MRMRMIEEEKEIVNRREIEQGDKKIVVLTNSAINRSKVT